MIGFTRITNLPINIFRVVRHLFIFHAYFRFYCFPGHDHRELFGRVVRARLCCCFIRRFCVCCVTHKERFAVARRDGFGTVRSGTRDTFGVATKQTRIRHPNYASRRLITIHSQGLVGGPIPASKVHTKRGDRDRQTYVVTEDVDVFPASEVTPDDSTEISCCSSAMDPITTLAVTIPRRTSSCRGSFSSGRRICSSVSLRTRGRDVSSID